MAVASIFSSSLPALVEVALAALVAGVGGAGVARFVCLRGPRAVRALEWPAGEGPFHLYLGACGRRLPAIPAGCRKYGREWWLLSFETVEGRARLLVDARYQDPQALRRLARRLFDLSGDGDGAFPGREAGN